MPILWGEKLSNLSQELFLHLDPLLPVDTDDIDLWRPLSKEVAHLL